LIRPGFWRSEKKWSVRVAFPETGTWKWSSYASDTNNKGLHGLTGSVIVHEYEGDDPFIKRGLLRMSPGKRNVVYADGTPFLMIGDTPWALPWRGSYESVMIYAQNRKERGFNTALLMSLQPDRDANGPRTRTDSLGFDVAFEDLKDGHINNLNPGYFEYLDSLRNILVSHGIVPVFQPVFHGFGWKGLNVLGWNIDSIEYSRYCRYLVARYGAKPAMWLVGADSDGRDKGVTEGGQEIELWDAYEQPTGLHYSPFDDRVPDWMDDFGGIYEPHRNGQHQEADWLDFQWCQTGHSGDHQLHKVAIMFDHLPSKAVANGEPTYEGIRDSLNASGWWQGHEAWSQFLSGGTMGVVYGAGGLWNWKLFAHEAGWPDWADSDVSWREAIELPGSRYVGYLGKAMEGLDITDIERHPELAEGKPCLTKPGKLFVVYMEEGGSVNLKNLPDSFLIRWFDPVNGVDVSELNGSRSDGSFYSPIQGPSVLIIQAK